MAKFHLSRLCVQFGQCHTIMITLPVATHTPRPKHAFDPRLIHSEPKKKDLKLIASGPSGF
jgi:hypothetical protein